LFLPDTFDNSSFSLDFDEVLVMSDIHSSNLNKDSMVKTIFVLTKSR